MTDKICNVDNVESGKAPCGASFDDNMARSTERELRRVCSNFNEAQRAIRETVLEVRSTDGQVSLKITGDGLAISIDIAQQLVTLGIPALERSVLEAINNAVIALQGLAIEHMQKAFSRTDIAMPEDTTYTTLNTKMEGTR